MNKTRNLAGMLVVVLSFGALSAIADDEISGTGMGDTTRTSGPTGSPGTTGGGGSASREGLVTEPNYPSGISAGAFMEQATEKNLAIVSTAELVLKTKDGTTVDASVRQFAEKMIDEHSNLNRQLNELAENGQLDVSDSAALIDRAQKMLLRVPGGESFGNAYASNQVADHQALLDLFSRAANSDLGEISRFAEQSLPKLEKHLEMARNLHTEAQNTEE
jgi:predicted outer membrane protein